MSRPQMSTATKALSVAGLAGLVFGSALTLDAQRPAPPAAGSLKPMIACAAMNGHAVAPSAVGLPIGGATIVSATLDAGSGPIPNKANFVPEHCYLKGVIKPVDPKAGNIEFAIAI